MTMALIGVAIILGVIIWGYTAWLTFRRCVLYHQREFTVLHIGWSDVVGYAIFSAVLGLIAPVTLIYHAIQIYGVPGNADQIACRVARVEPKKPRRY